jgi:hypothetical protein
MAKRNFKVSFRVTSTHTYHISDCNSQEEAESIAEEWFAAGESGDVEDTDIESVDVLEDNGEDS